MENWDEAEVCTWSGVVRESCMERGQPCELGQYAGELSVIADGRNVMPLEDTSKHKTVGQKWAVHAWLVLSECGQSGRNLIVIQ